MNVKICLDTRRIKKDGTYPVIVHIWNKNHIRIATGYTSTESNWDNKSCLYNKKESNYARKNVYLKDLLNKVERLLIELGEEKRAVSDKILRGMVSDLILPDDNRKKVKCFVDYLDEFIGKKSNNGTKSVYLGTRRKIELFDRSCTFESMDKKWLERFEDWMAETMKVNSRGIHLRNIRAVFNYAINEEYTTLYPFRKFQIKKEKTRKRKLTVEQLRILRDYPCEDYQEKYRDMFMLMFYLLGINAADLFLAKKTDIVNGRLEYKRAKTGRLYSIKIEPEAQEIIDRYSGNEENGYLLNITDSYSNYKDFLHRMDIGLKQIGEMERKGQGGKKDRSPLFPDLSSYWSRHTWATAANSLGISIETISLALGHSYGSPTTIIYIDFELKKVDEANRKVIDYVNGKKIPIQTNLYED